MFLGAYFLSIIVSIMLVSLPSADVKIPYQKMGELPAGVTFKGRNNAHVHPRLHTTSLHPTP